MAAAALASSEEAAAAADEQINQSLVLPEDLVYSILLNLPATNLFQFSYVSKRWHEIIQSRSFNLDRSILQQSSDGTSVENPAVGNIIQCYRYMIRNRSICLTGTIHRIWSNDFEPHESFNIKLPFDLEEKNAPEADRFYVSELSCDGLLCVVYKSSVCSLKHRIYFWNPYACKCRSVAWPEELKDDCFGDNIFVGFGYDSSSNGYKIVVMKAPTTRTTSGNKWQIQVTCLISDNNNKSSAWRAVEFSSLLPHNLVGGHFRPVSVEGDIYWLGKVKRNNSRHIMKFNLASETLTTLALPSEVTENLNTQIPNPKLEECGVSGRQRRIKLGHRNNKCLYLYLYNAYSNYTLGSAAMEIWKYSPKDGQQGFRKVLSVPETAVSDELGLIRPFGFTAKGDFIISCCNDESLVAYIPQQGKLEHLETGGYKFWPKYANKIGYAFIDAETLIVP